MSDTNRLRVGFCAYDCPDNVSGPSSWLGRLLPELRELGVDPFCFVLSWEQSGPLVERLKELGIPYVEHPCRPTAEERIRWILEKVKENPIDVFVPNHVVPGFYAGKWIRSAGVPTVGVLHSDDSFYRAIQSSFVHRESAFQVSSIVSVSDELSEQVSKYPHNNCQLAQIPYGVPIPDGSARRDSSKFRVAYVGRLTEEQKRISEVTRSFCRLVREVPDTEAVIYGDGPDKTRVEKILATEGQGLPVRLAGRIEPDQIQSELLKCHAVVLLSDYEGLPISILEAMACGVVPVCLAMRSGIDQLLSDGSGIIVDDRNEGFVQAIRELVDSEEKWSRISKLAQSKATKRFSIESNAKQWLDMLSELEASSPKRNKKLKWPERLKLPSSRQEFAGEDPRASKIPFTVKIYYRTRTFLGRIRRCLFVVPEDQTK